MRAKGRTLQRDISECVFHIEKSLINAGLTLYLGLYFLTGNFSFWVNLVFLFLMLAINLNFVVYWLIIFFREGYRKIKAMDFFKKIMARSHAKVAPGILATQEMEKENLVKPGDEQEIKEDKLAFLNENPELASNFGSPFSIF